MPTEAFITGDLLRWARERASVSPATLANSLDVSIDELAQWEAGTKYPSFRKAQAAASRLKIPFGYLYLSERPDDRLDLPDLRTPNDEEPEEPSVELLDIVEDAKLKQAWYREYRLETSPEPLPFVGRFSTATPHLSVAADIRNTLGIDTAFRREAKSWEDFARRVVRRCEESGIIVLRAGQVGGNTRRTLDPDEFKGFVISDPFAPIILVNSRDWKSSQVFTLGHELAHIWIGESGVSNVDLSEPSTPPDNDIERACNRIAAEVLVPGDDLRERWNARNSVAENVAAAASWYRVSELVALRQANDLNLISTEEYRADYGRQRTEWRDREDNLDDEIEEGGGKKKSSGNFWNGFFARNSATFAFTVMDAVVDGRTPSSEGASLLGLSRKTFESAIAKQFKVSSA